MPFIDVKITKKLSESQKNGIKYKLGEAISLFPGKDESWLMCSVTDDAKIWFRGNNSEDSAFVEVKLFGDINKGKADSFTASVCDYLSQELGVSPSRVYIRYEGGTDWGWNGSNF